MTHDEEFKYAGFWIRVWASLIDALCFVPILLVIYGTYNYVYLDIYVSDDYLYFLSSSEDFIAEPWESLIAHVLSFVIVILFWVYYQATPGKMLIRAKIVDAKTGQRPTTWQFVGRYLAYIPSALVFCLGFIWVAFDERKQGWHDKLAGTVVIRKKGGGVKPVQFDDPE